MFHVDTNLMSTSGFEYALYQRDISQPFKHPIMSDRVLAHRRVGHNRHLHPVFRISGDTAYNRAFILFHISPDKGTVSAFGRLIKELYSEVGLGIRRLGNHQQTGRIFINPVDQADVRVIGIIFRNIFHVPCQRIDKRTVIVSVSRMYYQSRRLVHYHYIWIFVNDIKGDIFGNNLVLITRTVHHDGNDIERLNLVAALHRLTVSHDESIFGSLLNTVARSIDNTFEQIFVDSDHRLSLVYDHPKMFVKLGFVTDRFYIIQIILQFIRKFFLDHVNLFRYLSIKTNYHPDLKGILRKQVHLPLQHFPWSRFPTVRFLRFLPSVSMQLPKVLYLPHSMSAPDI